MFVARCNKIKLVRMKNSLHFSIDFYDHRSQEGPFTILYKWVILFVQIWWRGTFNPCLSISFQIFSLSRGRAAWQLARLITLRSRVQIPSPQHFFDKKSRFDLINQKLIKMKNELLFFFFGGSRRRGRGDTLYYQSKLYLIPYTIKLNT